MSHLPKDVLKPIEWVNGKVRWLDVRMLPWDEVYRETSDYRRLAKAIKDMEIRGAPALGIAAAYGFALSLFNCKCKSKEALVNKAEETVKVLSTTRPTAHNLFWALNYMMQRLKEYIEQGLDIDIIRKLVVNDAVNLHQLDIETNLRIGENGAKLIEDGDTILTHCNTGSLATGGFGTALGVIRKAWSEGKKIKVIATETRPLLQGARLTVWELKKDGIPVTLITDNMAGYLMSKKMITKVIVGADRILLTGHVINKIGTYTLSLLASYHQIPFYVAAPITTVDAKNTPKNIVIEERHPDEVRTVMGKMYITVPDVEVINPAFDITPPENIDAIITEKGVIRKPFHENLRRVLEEYETR